jgi:hypothetical protein
MFATPSALQPSGRSFAQGGGIQLFGRARTLESPTGFSAGEYPALCQATR